MKMLPATFVSAVVLLLLPLTSRAFPTPQLADSHWGKNTSCSNPEIRKEWRTLKDSEKKAYIDANLCMFKRPSKAMSCPEFPANKNRFDDFITNHQNATQGLLAGTGGIHNVGVFLPWHRYLLALWEYALKTECGYKGALPYWDWTQDSDDYPSSPLFDPTTGFGGNGRPLKTTVDPGPSELGSLTNPVIPAATGGGCITNGPFKNVTLNVGPGTNTSDYNPRCLSRNFDPSLAKQWLTSHVVHGSMSQPNYASFRLSLEPINVPIGAGLHGGGHVSGGAELADTYSSPSDPLFYLHHAQIDRLWAKWQEQDTRKRLTDMQGPTIPHTIHNGTTTLDSMMWVATFEAPSLPIKTVMDTKSRHGGFLCYKYDK